MGVNLFPNQKWSQHEAPFQLDTNAGNANSNRPRRAWLYIWWLFSNRLDDNKVE